MTAHPMCRFIVLGAVIVLGLSGCYRDQRGGALTEVEAECAAASLVVEGLIESGGTRESAPVANLVALGEVASLDVRGAADHLVALTEMDGPSPENRTQWNAALDDLDGALRDRCEFSIRALVTDAGLRSDSADDGAVDADLGTDRPLDWEGVRSRVDGADWTERGYRGIVGLGPGIHVTVYGVESAQLAVTVCDDTLEALATEASTTEVTIEVHGLDEGLLAQTVSGVCTMR